MPMWSGVNAGRPLQPSADRSRKAAVDFSTESNKSKDVPWKGKPSPDGAKPSERKAINKPGKINDVKAMRTSKMGDAP